MTLGPGSRLGPYEISAPLGKGGMGDVFRARDTRLHRDVAVKALPAGFETDLERLGRFQREARVLASLNHANVGSIYGLEESTDGHSYLILECIEGETLAARLSGWPLPLDEALRIGAEIAAGLGAAHDAGVIHRDLKPANVMLRPDGAVKVLDFGLAKTAERGSAGSGDQSRSPTISVGTQTGIILGTAAYMSPEQARGRTLDKRTDIFSFGCVLYECLTGRRAFPGESVSDTLSAIVADEPDWSALPPSLPPRVRDLLRRCLQKDLRKRLHDISDARLELEDVQATPAPASTETVPTAVVRGASRRPQPWAWLAAGALLGAAVAAALLLSRRPPGTLPPSPRLQAVLSLPEGVRLLGGGRPSVALSPDGATVVFRGSQSGTPRLYRRRLDGSEAVALAGTEGGLNPFFSPDGEWIGFFTLTELKKVPLSGGAAVRISDAPPVAHGGTWTADGFILFSRTPNGGLYRVPENGGKPEPFTFLAPGEHGHLWPQALPGGRGILVTIVFGADFQDLASARIAVLETGSLRRKIVLEGSGYARYVDTGQLVFVRGKGLFAVPFDLTRLATSGTPVALPENLLVIEDGEFAHFASARGTLISPSGPALPPSQTAVWTVGRDGRGAALPLPPAQYSHPRLSPDGQRIALMRLDGQSGKLSVFDRSRQILSLLTSEPGRFFCPVWSPDGRRLAFTLFKVGEPRLAMKPADASRNVETVTENSSHAEFANSWSPDGKVIVYTVEDRKTETNAARVPMSLWTVTLGNKPESRLWLGGDFRNFAAAFSPDGRWIAYVSTKAGRERFISGHIPGPAAASRCRRTAARSPPGRAAGESSFTARATSSFPSSSRGIRSRSRARPWSSLRGPLTTVAEKTRPASTTSQRMETNSS